MVGFAEELKALTNQWDSAMAAVAARFPDMTEDQRAEVVGSSLREKMAHV